MIDPWETSLLRSYKATGEASARDLERRGGPTARPSTAGLALSWVGRSEPPSPDWSLLTPEQLFPNTTTTHWRRQGS